MKTIQTSDDFSSPLASKPLEKLVKKPLEQATKKRFETFVGIDVSKATLDICVIILGAVRASFKVENKPSQYQIIITKLQSIQGVKLENVVFCLENTGIYHQPFVQYFVHRQCAVWVENAYQIKHSMGLRRSKTDKADAKVIAMYAARHKDNFRPATLLSKEIKGIDVVLKMRDKLLNIKKMIEVEIQEIELMGMTDQVTLMSAMSQESLAGIEADLERCEAKLDEIIQSDPKLQQLYRLVTSVEGVGKIVGLHLLVATDRFTRYKNARKFACQIGIAPFQQQSGTSLHRPARVSYFGDKNIKKMLYFSAMTAVRKYGGLRAYYTKKVEEGKPKMLVLNAVKNKLLHRIFAVVKSGEPYDKFHEWQQN